MKRFRVFGGDFDYRAAQLVLDIPPEWEQSVKDLHRQNRTNTLIGLISEYGTNNGQVKVKNFEELGSKPISIVAFHNNFYQQARDAFIIGAYYPALTGACALGERILNHLMLRLRESYRNSPEYKKVYRKNSFDNWDLAINTLETWDVLLPEVVSAFRKLSNIRNQKAIHFNPETDTNDREYAIEALNQLSVIIGQQFSAIGPEPWFIANTRGSSFIKKDVENLPFVRELYITASNCVLVGPKHTVEFIATDGGYNVVVKDDHNYEQTEISDEEFAVLYNDHH